MVFHSKGAGKCKAPPPPLSRSSGELLHLDVLTLAGQCAQTDVSRTQSSADVLRQACGALGLEFMRGVYKLVIDDLEIVEARDGSAKLMYLQYPALFTTQKARGWLIRLPNGLRPGQQTKISFAMPKELHQQDEITQIHEMEGLVGGWLEDQSAWIIHPYGVAGRGIHNIDYCLVEPRHLLVRDPATRNWMKPDIPEGDASMAPKSNIEVSGVVHISRIIDEALETATELRRQSEAEFDNRRRTVEWAEAQCREREARLLQLVADGILGTVCVGSQQARKGEPDARWEGSAYGKCMPKPDRRRVPELAASLEPRILPLYHLRYA